MWGVAPALTFAVSPKWALRFSRPAEAARVFGALIHARRSQGFTLGHRHVGTGAAAKASTGAAAWGAAQGVQTVCMIGSLPFTPDVVTEPEDDRAILSHRASQEVVLLQYRIRLVGRTLRVHVLLEPRNGSVVGPLDGGLAGVDGRQGKAAPGGEVWKRQSRRVMLRDLLHQIGTQLFEQDEKIAKWFSSIYGICSACPGQAHGGAAGVAGAGGGGSGGVSAMPATPAVPAGLGDSAGLGGKGAMDGLVVEVCEASELMRYTRPPDMSSLLSVAKMHKEHVLPSLLALRPAEDDEEHRSGARESSAQKQKDQVQSTRGSRGGREQMRRSEPGSPSQPPHRVSDSSQTERDNDRESESRGSPAGEAQGGGGGEASGVSASGGADSCGGGGEESVRYSSDDGGSREWLRQGLQSLRKGLVSSVAAMTDIEWTLGASEREKLGLGADAVCFVKRLDALPVESRQASPSVERLPSGDADREGRGAGGSGDDGYQQLLVVLVGGQPPALSDDAGQGGGVGLSIRTYIVHDVSFGDEERARVWGGGGAADKRWLTDMLKEYRTQNVRNAGVHGGQEEVGGEGGAAAPAVPHLAPDALDRIHARRCV